MKFAIIAAGNGSRMASEGASLPKPLVEIGGVPMIKRLIDVFIKCGATSIAIIINEKMHDVRDYLASLNVAAKLDVVAKTTSGSMLSFYELREYAGDEKFCLSTVDAIFDEQEFLQYIAMFEQNVTADGYMAVTSFIDDEYPLYIDADDSGIINRFSDEIFAGNRLVSGGIYALTHRAIDVLCDCVKRGINDMRDYQRALIEAGLKLQAYEFSKIVDVDHVGDIATANAFIADLESRQM